MLLPRFSASAPSALIRETNELSVQLAKLLDKIRVRYEFVYYFFYSSVASVFRTNANLANSYL